jgi:hypothetical protein
MAYESPALTAFKEHYYVGAPVTFALFRMFGGNNEEFRELNAKVVDNEPNLWNHVIVEAEDDSVFECLGETNMGGGPRRHYLLNTCHMRRRDGTPYPTQPPVAYDA